MNMSGTAKSTQACARLLKLLADETRLAVVLQLIDRPKHVGELNKSLRLEQSLLSHHLRILREARLVLAKRDGKAVLYSLAAELRVPGCKNGIDFGCCQIAFA
jgi:ArsR family transcriptional regulator